jgi:hypothetical protein
MTRACCFYARIRRETRSCRGWLFAQIRLPLEEYALKARDKVSRGASRAEHRGDRVSKGISRVKA